MNTITGLVFFCATLFIFTIIFCVNLNFSILIYNARQLYQYTNDDFLLFMRVSITSIFHITSLQVNKEILVIDNFSLHTCLRVSAV